MAQERLILIDDMSPALQRIAQAAEKAYASFHKLQRTPKTLIGTGEVSRAIADIQRLEKEFKRSQESISQRARKIVQAGHPSVTFDKQGRYNVNGIPVHPSQVPILEQRLVQNQARAQEISAWRRNQSFAARVGALGYFRQGNLFDKFALGFSNLNRSTEGLSTKFLRLAGVLGSVEYLFHTLVSLGKMIIEPQDKYVGNLTRTALTSDFTKEPAERLNEMYEVAKRTRADATGTMSLYNRIAMSGVRASNDRIMRFVETFNKTMAISGTTAQENRAVMLQLAQGMGSNRLGGDEFRSIAEQAPMFKYMLAKGLGVNPGQLKQMGAQGKLTAEAIMSALEKQQNEIDTIYKDAPWTIGQGIIYMQTTWEQAIKDNMAGYVALRDLIMDINAWLNKPEGRKHMNHLIDATNKFIIRCVDFFRKMVPLIKWVITHLHLLGQIVRFFVGAWMFGSLLGNLLKLHASIVDIAKAGQFMGIAVSNGLLNVARVTSVAMMGMMGYISALILAWQLGQKIADWRNEQESKHAMDWNWKEHFAMRKSTVDAQMDQWRATHKGAKAYEYSRQRKLYEAEFDQRMKSARDAKELQKQQYLSGLKSPEEIQLENLSKQYSGIKGIEGMMNSATNKPMDVNTVKNVDHVNGDINLSTESIQMMKAIAERQWINQNEVVVPQNVNIDINNGGDLSQDDILSTIHDGIQNAVASSMRGGMVA